MQDPEILLADEPVASLDPESSGQVMNLIREIASERGLTVLCSLHQVDLALGWGDRIIGLRAGQVVLDTQTEGLSREQVMEIYGRVTTSTSELAAIESELADVRQEAAERGAQQGARPEARRRRLVTELATRVAAVRRPAPKPATIVSVVVLLVLLVLGVASIGALGFSIPSMIDSLDNIPQFVQRATPFAWPGWIYDRETATLGWEGWAPVGEFWAAVAQTLGIVIVGTGIAALISIPVAYGAARNTSPNPAVMAICRGIGIVARSIPAIALRECLRVPVRARGRCPASSPSRCTRSA